MAWCLWSVSLSAVRSSDLIILSQDQQGFTPLLLRQHFSQSQTAVRFTMTPSAVGRENHRFPFLQNVKLSFRKFAILCAVYISQKQSAEVLWLFSPMLSFTLTLQRNRSRSPQETLLLCVEIKSVRLSEEERDGDFDAGVWLILNNECIMFI